jgi:hypothetical protein
MRSAPAVKADSVTSCFDFADSLKDWVVETLDVMNKSLDRGDSDLDEELRDRLAFLHTAVRHVCISRQISPATHERGESRPVGNLVAWDVAVKSAELEGPTVP